MSILVIYMTGIIEAPKAFNSNHVELLALQQYNINPSIIIKYILVVGINLFGVNVHIYFLFMQPDILFYIVGFFLFSSLMFITVPTSTQAL